MKNVILGFNVGDVEILRIQLDMSHKTSTILSKGNELGLQPILKPAERTYFGIEHRLQWMMHTTNNLPQIIETIEHEGFRFDGQHNLFIDVIHI